MARIVLRPVTLLALACALVAAPPATAAGPETTANALARAMRSAGAASGAIAVDLDTGSTLYQLRADTPRIPASVEKLYTSSTALLRLGPEETLSTTVLGESAIAGGRHAHRQPLPARRRRSDVRHQRRLAAGRPAQERGAAQR